MIFLITYTKKNQPKQIFKLPIQATSEKMATVLFYQVMPKSCVKITKIESLD